MKKLLFLVYGIWFFASFGFALGQKEASDGKLVVATAFHAVNELVYGVVGDKAHLVSLVPENADVHHYEPRPKDIQNLNKADVVFVVGLGLEEWIEELVEDGLLRRDKVVVLSEGLSLIELDEDEHHAHGDHHQDEDYDPHVWLSLREAAKMVDTISKTLSRLDSANASYYQANAKRLSGELLGLLNEFQPKFASAKKNKLLVAHEAFGYLCRDFGIEQLGVSDVYNEGEPSAKNLTKLVDFCRANNVSVIFSEKNSSLGIAQTVAREVKARIETLYTMETAEEGLSFLQRYRLNLEHILDALTQ